MVRHTEILQFYLILTFQSPRIHLDISGNLMGTKPVDKKHNRTIFFYFEMNGDHLYNMFYSKTTIKTQLNVILGTF